MTHPALITLNSVSYALPQGTVLFTGLNARLDLQHTALIGPNGIGKSILAELICGLRLPTEGAIERHVSIRFLPQQDEHTPQDAILDLLGAGERLAALTRIERGEGAMADFDTLAEHWSLRIDLDALMGLYGLSHLTLNTPASCLSGGERAALRLAGAFLSTADYLILDEPTNHLDTAQRERFLDQLAQWKKGVLIITHDRVVLNALSRIIALSDRGLDNYGGNFSFYLQSRQQQTEAATRTLEQARIARKRNEQAIRQTQTRQARRQAQGARSRHDTNQAKILLDRQRDRSEHTSRRLHIQHDMQRNTHETAVREAMQQVSLYQPPVLLASPDLLPSTNKPVSILQDVQFRFWPKDFRPLNLTLRGNTRLAICGPNGCGKSALLHLLAGKRPPDAGQCRSLAPAAYLDQQCAHLHPDQSPLAHLQTAHPGLDEGTARTRLALLGLGSRQVLSPLGLLSGGEKVRAALACLLYAQHPAPLLLLDEPNNHLDLDTLAALSATLRQYQGALVVVSHDPFFLGDLALTETLNWTPTGWSLTA